MLQFCIFLGYFPVFHKYRVAQHHTLAHIMISAVLSHPLASGCIQNIWSKHGDNAYKLQNSFGDHFTRETLSREREFGYFLRDIFLLLSHVKKGCLPTVGRAHVPPFALRGLLQSDWRLTVWPVSGDAVLLRFQPAEWVSLRPHPFPA